MQNKLLQKLTVALQNNLNLSPVYGLAASTHFKIQQQNYSNYRNMALNKKHFDEFRKWSDIKTSGHQHSGDLEFKVMSYNILAQDLLQMHPYLYHHHNRQSLQWPNRYRLILHEVLDIRPDILCLQEVQSTHLEQLHIGLKTLNYKFLYKKRTGGKSDGCTIFYNDLLFKLEDHHYVEYEQPGIELLNRENVAIIAKLSLKTDPIVKFLVATTHLLYNPKRQDVRLVQIQVLLAELDRMSSIPDKNSPSNELSKVNCPIILTGDFNLQPYSAPFELIAEGKLAYANLTQRTLKVNTGNNAPITGRKLLPIKLGISDNCQHVNENNIRIGDTKLYHSDNKKSAVNISLDVSDLPLNTNNVDYFQTGSLRHNLNLIPAYSPPTDMASTHQDAWVLVDYIFYSSPQNSVSGKLSLKSTLKLPTPEECMQIGRIPNEMFGSDHLSLAAKFLLKRHVAAEPRNAIKVKGHL